MAGSRALDAVPNRDRVHVPVVPATPIELDMAMVCTSTVGVSARHHSTWYAVMALPPVLAGSVQVTSRVEMGVGREVTWKKGDMGGFD